MCCSQNQSVLLISAAGTKDGADPDVVFVSFPDQLLLRNFCARHTHGLQTDMRNSFRYLESVVKWVRSIYIHRDLSAIDA